MRILFICDEYPPGKHGGIGTSVQVLGKELVNQGHQVFVVGLYAYSYGEKDYEEDQGVKVWRLRYGVNLHLPPNHIAHKMFNKIPDFIKQHLNGRKAFSRFITFINKLVNENKIDVIEIADWNTFAMRIGFLVKYPILSVPLILKSHGSYSYFCNEMNEKPKEKLLKIDRELYERADALSSVSSYTKNRNEFLFSLKKESKILHNGIDLPKFEFLEKTNNKKVIFAGTLVEKKGIFQLIKAWDFVHKKHSDAVLEVYGKGNTEVLINLLNPETVSSVHFKGHVNRKGLFNELARATVAVFPSYSEAFSLAPMEAMAVGCPVIYTERASGKELIDNGENGMIVNPDNIEDIAEKINLLIEDKLLREKFSANGKKTIETRFQISHIAKKHITYYQTIINNFKSKHYATTNQKTTKSI